jgi:hypothetical protein
MARPPDFWPVTCRLSEAAKAPANRFRASKVKVCSICHRRGRLLTSVSYPCPKYINQPRPNSATIKHTKVYAP